MASQSLPVYHRITGTHTAIDGTGEISGGEQTTLQFPSFNGTDHRSQTWLLVSFHYERTDGTATTYAPSLGQVLGYSSTGISERLSYSATAVTTEISEVFSQPIPCRTDADGRLYFRPDFNTSDDNDGLYEFWFRKALG